MRLFAILLAVASIFLSPGVQAQSKEVPPDQLVKSVTDEVLDGPQSRVWPEAANRLPAARGALEWLLTEVGFLSEDRSQRRVPVN